MADTGTAGWVRRDAEPFEVGNMRAATHRARSRREVEALAAQLVAELLASPDCPGYLHEARFSERVAKWGEATAKHQLLSDYVDGLGFEQVLAEWGGAEAPSRDRRAAPAFEALMRAGTTAALARERLGLTPASRQAMCESGEIPAEYAIPLPPE